MPRSLLALCVQIRHAAAKAFGELGLRDVATVEGWVALPPELPSVAAYGAALERRGPDGEPEVPLLTDPDPAILERMAQREAARLQADPAPLEAYYDVGRSWWVAERRRRMQGWLAGCCSSPREGPAAVEPPSHPPAG